MTIELTPEPDVPLTQDLAPDTDLRVRMAAVDNTVSLLVKHGLDDTPNKQDREFAASTMSEYISQPQTTSRKLTNTAAANLTPASCREIKSYLDEYGRQVVTHALAVRHLVTNRLLEESTNADPRVRIKALELLGKVSDVGLFSERTEVTITHQTTDELRAKLRAKMQKLIRVEDAEPGVITLDNEVIDVDAELGFKSDSDEDYDD